MTRIILLFLALSTSALRGQWLSTPTVLPQAPLPTDTVRVIVETMTPNLGHKLMRSFTVKPSGLVHITICNYSGMLTAIGMYVDTFVVGVLPAGIHTIQVDYHISWDYTLCITQSSYTASHPFTVQNVTGEQDQAVRKFQWRYDPASERLYVDGPDPSQPPFLLDLFGRHIMTLRRGDTGNDLTRLPGGVYMIAGPPGWPVQKFVVGRQ